jgi:glycogenin glucosyltransferase
MQTLHIQASFDNYSKCNDNKRVCKKIGEMTTFQPCFTSVQMLSSNSTCHDTISCTEKFGMNRSQLKMTMKNKSSKRAFFSALYTDNYLLGALLLGYTLKRHHSNINMFIITINDNISKESLCALQLEGWNIVSVSNIAPPLQGTWPHFVNQFTKLILWNMTEFNSIVYLDSDTLVLDDISHLHALVEDPFRTGFDFAAAADIWFGKFAYHFNAGVLVLHPCEFVFKEFMRTFEIAGNYDPLMAEQAFLNAFYQLRYLQLPLIYNVNLALYSGYPDLWEALKKDFKIVHFTLSKPFLNQSVPAYEQPIQLYLEVWNTYRKSAQFEEIKFQCRLKYM